MPSARANKPLNSLCISPLKIEITKIELHIAKISACESLEVCRPLLARPKCGTYFSGLRCQMPILDGRFLFFDYSNPCGASMFASRSNR